MIPTTPSSRTPLQASSNFSRPLDAAKKTRSKGEDLDSFTERKHHHESDVQQQRKTSTQPHKTHVHTSTHNDKFSSKPGKRNGPRHRRSNRSLACHVLDKVRDFEARRAEGFRSHSPSAMKRGMSEAKQPDISSGPKDDVADLGVHRDPRKLSNQRQQLIFERENRVLKLYDDVASYTIASPKSIRWWRHSLHLIFPGLVALNEVVEHTVELPCSLVNELSAVMVPVRADDKSWLLLAQAKTQELLREVDVTPAEFQYLCINLPLCVFYNYRHQFEVAYRAVDEENCLTYPLRLHRHSGFTLPRMVLYVAPTFRFATRVAVCYLLWRSLSAVSTWTFTSISRARDNSLSALCSFAGFQGGKTWCSSLLAAWIGDFAFFSRPSFHRVAGSKDLSPFVSL